MICEKIKHVLQIYINCNKLNIIMLKITETVKEILLNSETASTSLKNGYMNLSAYAKKVQKEVEHKTKKPVSCGTIVVALSRISKNIKPEDILIPTVLVKDLTIKSPLIEITYPKSAKTVEILRKLQNEIKTDTSDFVTITQGVGEITIIISERLKTTVHSYFKNIKPIFSLESLASLTVKFPSQYIDQPNIMYAIMRTLAIKKINIIEIVSTYTELTFILKNQDLQNAFNTISTLYN